MNLANTLEQSKTETTLVPYHCHHCGVELAKTDWQILKIPGSPCYQVKMLLLICEGCKGGTYWRPSERKTREKTS